MNPLVKYTLLFFALVLALGIGLSLTGDADARLAVWDGEGLDALASNPLNWDTDVAPVPNDIILFDGLHLVNASADDPCTWDLANNSFGNFTILVTYSGTITQSSDMYITGYSQAGGTFTGVTTKWVYCSGSFVITAGTFTELKTCLELSGSDKIFSATMLPYVLNITGTYTLDANREVYFPDGGTVLIPGSLVLGNSNARIVIVLGYPSNNREAQNQMIGNITGIGYIELFVQYYSQTLAGDYSGVSVAVKMDLRNDSGTNKVITLGRSPGFTGTVNIYSNDATYTCTVDTNGFSLTPSTITVGTRGILSNSAATDSVVTCGTFDSSAGTFTETNIDLIMNDGSLICISGQKIEDLSMIGSVDIVNSVNVTGTFDFISVDPSYDDIDVYLDGVYSVTIPDPYSYGPEVTDAALYSYLPDIEITMGQFYEDIDFSIYASISSNLPVTYNITGTASSFLTYHEGNIVGMPPNIGNYTYTITATHASGSIDIVNGYILVGSLSTAEFSFDMIWELMFWIAITLFMLMGLLLRIPLIQIIALVVGIGNIINTLRIGHFEGFTLLFILGNLALFLAGMTIYRSKK